MASATEQAVRRLETALQDLEIALEQRLTGGAGSDGMADEVRMLSADRARLAEHLDQAQARAVKFDNISRDVSRRLAATAETIRELLRAEAGET